MFYYYYSFVFVQIYPITLQVYNKDKLFNILYKDKYLYTKHFADRDTENVCNPSPCGANAICKEVNGQPVCSCMTNYIGSPPNCAPECVVNSQCKTNRACVNQRCVNPCPKPCGQNTDCKVINHSPVCSCRSGYSGNPFTTCLAVSCKL